MFPKIYAFYALFFLFCVNANAQNSNQNPTQQRGNISGQIREAGEPLIGVSVVLQRQRDSLPISSISSDDKGSFKFEQLAADTYAIRLSYIGYESVKIQNIRLPANTSFALDTVKMRPAATDFGELVVEATLIKVQMIGDTIQYNAAAFKTNPDAMVEDLIKKMAGVTIENGVVKAQGQVVTKITIDGQDYFGDDVMAAIKNIPASEVDKIQFFNAQSDKAALTGIKDATPEKGMNIVTKSGNFKGVFGKFDAAYGTDSRYNVGGSFNKFGKKRRISVIGRANNINQQGFSFEDMTISDGQNDPISLWGDNAFNYNFGAGINSSQVIGINYNERLSKKIKLSASYSTGFVQNKNTATLLRQYLPRAEPTNIQSYDEQTTSQQKQLHHRFASEIEYDIDSLTTLEIDANFSWQGGQKLGNFIGTNTIDSLFSNSSQTINNSSNLNYNGDLDINLSRKLNKPRRSISVNLYGELKNRQLNRLQISENTFANAIANQANNQLKINQLSQNKNNNNQLNTWLEYTEPISKKGALKFSYSADQTLSSNNNRTNNFMPNNTYSGLDTILSNTFNNNPFEQSAYISYHFDNSLGQNPLIGAPKDSTQRPPKNFNFHISLAYQNSQLKGQQTFPNSFALGRSYHNLQGGLNFNYRFSPQASFQIHYNLNPTLPNLSQLQILVNNQNPLFLSSGNRSLRQSIDQHLHVNYMNFNIKNNSSIFAYINVKTTQNYIGNSVLIANNDTLINNNLPLGKGAQFSQAANLGRAWESDGALLKSFSLAKLKLAANLAVFYSFSSLPALINGQKSRTNNGTANFRLSLNSNISEKFDFNFSFSAAQNLSYNSQTKQLNHSTNQSSSFNTTYYFAKRLVASLSVQQNAIFGMSSGFNRNFLSLGGSFGFTFLKDNRAQLSLSIHDALAQNADISRQMFDIYYEDRSTVVLRRYTLLRFSYRLNASKSQNNIQFIGG